MSHNISGFGLVLSLTASNTFPSGFTVTQFADDGDPFDSPSIQVADKAMGLNGDLVTWTKANPINVTLNIIPDSEDDQNLAVLFEANRAAKGKIPARDEITITGVYPDDKTVTLSGGFITDGMPLNSVASAGRLKSKPYAFTFESVVRA